MRRWRLALVLPAAAIAMLVGAVPAQAKGPSQATISGPGLAQPIVVAGFGEPGTGDPLSALAQDSGMFLLFFGPGTGYGTMLGRPPAGDLGPKYSLEYQVPAGEVATVRQDLYPFAAAGPVTYTPPGQHLFGRVTRGPEWYRGPASFGALLTSLGVTAPKPSSVSPSQASVNVAATHRSARSHGSWAGPIALGGALVVVLLAGGGLLIRRHGSATGP